MLEFPVMSTSRLQPVAFVAEVEGAANHSHSLIPSRYYRGRAPRSGFSDWPAQ
jgi:hypothetical protein